MKRSKKLLIFSLLLFIITIHGNSIYAKEDEEVKATDFSVIPKIVCNIFPGCDSDKRNPTITPTLDPKPTDVPLPSGKPFPTTNPSITPPPGKCMPPGGRISCGSRNVPVNGCGHCGVGYGTPSYCYTSNDSDIKTGGQAQAIDIAHKPLDSVPLPFLLGHTIIWHHLGENSYSGDPASYQDYTGTDTVSKKKYILRYLHTQRGSGIPLGTDANSGNEGAKVCLNWLSYNGNTKRIVRGNHIHIQIYDTEVRKWVEAPNYYCRN